MSRLATVDDRLAELVQGATSERCRAAALAAADFARIRTGMTDKKIEVLLLAIRNGRIGDTAERRAVDALAERLDEEHWNLQDGPKSGGPEVEPNLQTFSAARTASAASFAADIDAHVAALEALYEAHSAVDDLDALRRVVIPILA